MAELLLCRVVECGFILSSFLSRHSLDPSLGINGVERTVMQVCLTSRTGPLTGEFVPSLGLTPAGSHLLHGSHLPRRRTDLSRLKTPSVTCNAEQAHNLCECSLRTAAFERET